MIIPTALAILAAFVYAVGARRMRRRWPIARTGLFFAGLASFLAALAPPIGSWAADLFSVHMVQHMVLTIVAAPLVLLGHPIRPLLRGLPRAVRAGVVRPLARSGAVRALVHALRLPLVAGMLYVGGLYYFHLPAIYDAAVFDPLLHELEHAWFVGTALLFWSVVIDPEPFRATLPYGARIVYLLLAGAAQNTILGGVLSFSGRILYASYASVPLEHGIDPLTDQRVGGAVMWVGGDMIFLAAASFAFFRWLAEEERQQLARESRPREAPSETTRPAPRSGAE